MTHFYAVIATTEETALSQFNLFSPKMSCCIVQNETDFFLEKVNILKKSKYFVEKEKRAEELKRKK